MTSKKTELNIPNGYVKLHLSMILILVPSVVTFLILGGGRNISKDGAILFVVIAAMAMLPILYLISVRWRKVFVDQALGTVEVRSGMLSPAIKRIPIASIIQIQLDIAQEATGRNAGRETFYPVIIRSDSDKPHEIYRTTDYQEARNLAKELATLTEKDFLDSSTMTETSQKAGELQLSVGEKLQQNDEATLELEHIQAPSGTVVDVQHGPNKLSIALPKTGFDLGSTLLLSGFTLFFSGLIGSILYSMFGEYGELGLVIGAIPAIFIFRAMLFDALSRTLLQLEGTSFKHIQTGLFSDDVCTYDFKDIEEIFTSELKNEDEHPGARVKSAGTVEVRTTKDSFSFGAHLSKEERQYILQLLLAMLKKA